MLTPPDARIEFTDHQVFVDGGSTIDKESDAVVLDQWEHTMRVHHPPIADEQLNARVVNEDPKPQLSDGGIEGSLGFTSISGVERGAPVDIDIAAVKGCARGNMTRASGRTAQLEANVCWRCAWVPGEVARQLVCGGLDVQVEVTGELDITKMVLRSDVVFQR